MMEKKEKSSSLMQGCRFVPDLCYILGALLLGLMDQRRGSARGMTQMIFANLIGLPVLLFAIPSMKKEFLQSKLGKTAAGILAGLFLLLVGIFKILPVSWGLWNSAAFSFCCIAFMAVYLFYERRDIRNFFSVTGTGYGMILTGLLLMLISVNKTTWPGLYLLLFGCFYLIGIREDFRERFVRDLMIGFLFWFLIQQGLAFLFRPYDYFRYRGMYLGETQNGLFYMIVFCACLGLWIFCRTKGKRRTGLFVLAAACVALVVLTGGKSSLLGCVMGAVTGLAGYDLFVRKSLKHWIPQGIALALCAIVLFPVMYGCIRYIPTVLHHPVWFDGEYNEDRSVRSFDPWDSERYVTFEKCVNKNLGRMLKVVGISLSIEEGKLHIQTPFSLKSDAAEPGSSAENPYLTGKETKASDGAVDPARIAIWRYFIKHLNWRGHQGLIFYYREDVPFGNAHNMFLHAAVLYGIVPGILFLTWNAYCLVRILKRRDLTGVICAMLLVAIFSYGMFEQAITTGQITLSLIFILNYFGMEKQEKQTKNTKKNK